MDERRAILEEMYAAAVEAAAPGAAVEAALDRLDVGGRVRVIAIGKAADGMAGAAERWIRRSGRELAGGIVVGSADPGRAAPGSLARVAGNHPRPGEASVEAARLIGEAVALVDPDDSVLVLLSGGASSLAGAPVAGLSPDDLARLNDLLLGSGLDIAGINGVRKRFSRWGAGRLARALSPARVHCLMLSDVPGDDPALIGSGPCSADPLRAADVRSILQRAGIWDSVPPAARRLLHSAEHGGTEETPKPGSPDLAGVELLVIGNSESALAGAAARGRALGLSPEVMPGSLRGEAAEAGRELGRRLVAGSGGGCIIMGGETVVTLGGAHGTGGRCQELALAAAEVIAGSPTAALLAAGSDGRDGPTDAAGAVVSGASWAGIISAGRSPAQDLARHDAFPALASIGALLPARATGTNVADVVIALT